MKKTSRTRELTNSFCIIERGNGAPLCLSMDTAARRREAHMSARSFLGISRGDSLEVWQGDPNGEGDAAPVLIGSYSRTKGFVGAVKPTYLKIPAAQRARTTSPLQSAKDALAKDRDALIARDLADADTFPEQKVRSLLKFYIRECEKTYKARDAARAEVAELKERFVGEQEVFTSEEVELITRVAEWGSTATHLVDAKALTRLQVAEYVTVEDSFYHLTNKGRELQAEFKAAAVRASETALRGRLRFLLNELAKAPEERKAKAQEAIDTLIRNEL